MLNSDLTCFFRDKHEVDIINETTLKCRHCKRYFKEVDVNGNLITDETNCENKS